MLGGDVGGVVVRRGGGLLEPDDGAEDVPGLEEDGEAGPAVA